MIDTSGLIEADVLAVLYNSSRPQGMGFVEHDDEEMTRREAEELLKDRAYFDYLKGRVMKVNLKDDSSFDPRDYDRDNGSGAAQRAVELLRASHGPINSETKKSHREGVETAAALTYNRLHQETRQRGNVITLGLADVKDDLKQAVDRAKKSVK